MIRSLAKQTETTQTLDPVTFEVLKNAYVNIVDQMAEQILRTCYSFVIYSRDFSSALCDANGDTIITLVSDDNFSPIQRNLLLQFALVED